MGCLHRGESLMPEKSNEVGSSGFKNKEDML